MVDIPEYKRDESKDYLFILRSLNEIPFPVGKGLLSAFLGGDIDHPSIQKNKLFELHNFGSLDHIGEKVDFLIQDLTIKGLIDESPAIFNKFIKVLGISIKGQKELISPTIYEKQIAGKYEAKETDITDEEIKVFKELEDFLSGLNKEQKKSVISSHKKILCIAGAGTGKTTVLTKRIQFLNKMKKIRSDEILAITFTRKAKQEMKERLNELGVNAVVETFNSFCEKILLKNGGRIYGKKVRIASYQDKMMGVLRALDSVGMNLNDVIEKYFDGNQKKKKTPYQLQGMLINDCFAVLEYYKSTKKNLEDFSVGLKGKDYDNAKMIYGIVKFLEKHMLISGLRTYTDQINDALSFLNSNEKYIPKFQHVLVDEYQDVNSQQVELLKILKPENLFCVGDPRQSIFGWRGSDVDYILNFAKKEDVEVITLTKNYRSNNHIVNLMNKSIESMKMPDLNYHLEEAKQIKLCKFPSEQVELDFIGKKILISKTQRNEIFILARTNRQLSEISESLKRKGIKYVLKNDEAKDILAKEDEVTLSTIHSIKGLEAKDVYVIGCTINNFPCRASEHPIIELVKMYEYDKSEEEKRLFYVAISRAKTKLYMTYHGKKHTYFITDSMKELMDEISF